MPTSDQDVLDALRDTPDPVSTASEVADRLPVGRRSVLNRLNSLHDDDRIRKKDVGARSAVWWVPSREGGFPSSEQAGSDVGNAGSHERGGGSHEGIRDAVEGLDAIPGQGWKREQRVEAVIAAYEYLRRERDVDAEEFRDVVYPEHPAGYDRGEDPGWSWWKNCVYPGLRELSDWDGGVRVADSSGRWRYETGE